MRKQGVTRLFSVFFVLGALLPALPAHAEVHWDVPRNLAASTDVEQLSGLRVVRWRGRFYLFMLARGEKRAVIRYFSTGDLNTFRGPRTAVEDIPVEPGFFPRFDVLAADRGLYLAWNGPDGPGEKHGRKLLGTAPGPAASRGAQLRSPPDGG